MSIIYPEKIYYVSGYHKIGTKIGAICVPRWIVWRIYDKVQRILRIFSPKYWAFDASLQQCRDFVCGKHQIGDSQLIDVCHGIGVFE